MTDPARARVLYQGEPGAYSEEAVRALLGADARPDPCRSFQEVARRVVEGEAPFGLLPVENTLAGSVVASYDVLSREPLEVIREVIRPIRHCLLGMTGSDVEGLDRVLSHPVALAQCSDFFRNHEALEAVAVYDTAGAARRVAEEGDRSVAAIAGRDAAERHGLQVLASDLQDRDDNQTRFYLVRRAGGEDAAADVPGRTSAADGEEGPTDAWKSALVLRTDNRPGALVRVLRPLAERGVNLSKLESRPGADPWTYRFFLEFEARADRDPGLSAVDEARAAAAELRVLGVFPRWSGEGAGLAGGDVP